MSNSRLQLLTEEEFEDIKKRRDWEEIRRRFVRRPAGRKAEGSQPLTPAEKMRRYRERLKGDSQ